MQLLRPEMLAVVIPVLLVLFYLIPREFVKLPEDPYFQKRKRKWRKWIFISRTVIAILLAIALAQPFDEVTRQTSGDPQITVLIDESNSMEMFNMSFVDGFLDDLGSEIPLKVRRIGGDEVSDIGEGILANMEQGDNILLITDGNNNEGAGMGDVALFAQSSNATISALDLTPDQRDIGVSILGPKKLVESINNTFLIRVTKPNVDFYHLTVTIDGVVEMEVDTDKELVYLEKQFQQNGYHTIKAEVTVAGEDYFQQNNVYYKTVNVIDKPRILYLTEKTSPLEQILRELYDVQRATSLPNDLSQYYAVVINDMPAERFRQSDLITDYLIEGNGMVVFGGFNSFDRGNYKNSIFEQVLPVKVGTAERKFSDNTVVISIDRSSGGGKCRTIIDTVTKTKEEVCSDLSYTDVIKAQAVELLDQFDETNRVGSVAFDTSAYLIEPIDYLYNNKNRMVEKIRTIQPGGNTLVSKGVTGAYNLLSNEGGNRYVILLTDGITWVGDREETVNLAGSLYQQGIKLITVGIGRSVYDDFLKGTASNGGGFYISASNKNRLKVLFGDPEKEEGDDNYALMVVNSGHFITRNLDPNAVMRGFNQVLPKSSAELVIATDTGEPALTVWRYGLGKVATWNVFSGGTRGELLNEQNSLVLTRTVNWAIGDPERKKAYFVNVPDGRVGKPLKIEVKADSIPSAEGLSFVKRDENIYEATITPQDTGFGSALDAEYAVNYPVEYEETGMNIGLENTIESTGGNLFKPDEIESIVEFVQSVSRRTVTERTIIVWPFLLTAMLIFLLEVLVRRISENRMLEARK